MVRETPPRLAALPDVEEAVPLPAPGPERLRSMVDAQLDRVWRLLRRLGVPERSLEDAVQEVFEVASRRVDDIRPGSEQTFLFGTALRVAKGLRRDTARELARVARFDDDLASADKSPEEQLEERRKLAMLDEILAQLRAAEREVFVLFELEGLTLDEIATLLSIPRGTAASRLRRARHRFVRALRTRRAAGERGNHG
jgi:RNA polymerase sigma-70 factor (ECF subfamily)